MAKDVEINGWRMRSHGEANSVARDGLVYLVLVRINDENQSRILCNFFAIVLYLTVLELGEKRW